MAMRYGYFDSEITGVDENGMPIFDRAETSDLFRMLFASLVSNGVLATPGDCFQVVAGAGMTVRIRPGFAMIKGAFAYDADEATVTLAAANANLTRLDRVVLRCNYHDRCCEIIVKTGTPATIPVAPELLQPVNGDYYELGLALITVAANQAAITQSSISDTRADSSVCGLITQLIDHIDTSEFMQQLTTWQEEYAAEQQAAFSTWFEAMKDQLSEDAAGNLQLEIDNLSQSAEAHEESIGQINEIIGDADMGTTATTVTGAINELSTNIGSTAMGTTAPTVTGAIAEHESDISGIVSRTDKFYLFRFPSISTADDPSAIGAALQAILNQNLGDITFICYIFRTGAWQLNGYGSVRSNEARATFVNGYNGQIVVVSRTTTSALTVIRTL